jgi:hypothetical protein
MIITIIITITIALWTVGRNAHRASTACSEMGSPFLTKEGRGGGHIGVRCYMSEPMDLREIAKKIAELRREKILEPNGHFDDKRRWYPDEAVEKASCCSSIRPPSAAYPSNYLYHVMTVKHVETLLKEKPYAIEWMDEDTLNHHKLKPDMLEEVLKQYEDKYSEFMKEMTLIRWFFKLEEDIGKRLLEEIKYMSPLSPKKVEVINIDINNESGLPYGKLYVHEWLSIVYGGRRKMITADLVIPVLQRYGDLIAEHVMQEKRANFMKVVMLVKKVKTYPSTEYEDKEHGLKIDLHVWRFTGKGLRYWYSVFEREALVRLDEQTFNALVHMTEKLERMLLDINEDNNNIVKEIDKIVRPYRLSKELAK